LTTEYKTKNPDIMNSNQKKRADSSDEAVIKQLKNVRSSTKTLDFISILLTIGFSAAFGLLVSIPVFYFLGTAWGLLTILAGTILAAIAMFVYFVSTIQKVPHSHVWVIEYLGAFKVLWAAGGHMYFPFFSWLELREEVSLNEEVIELFPDKNDLVDMEDDSCHIKASVVGKVKFPLLAVYNIEDYKEAVRSRVAGLLRYHLSRYTIDQVNEDKRAINFDMVMIEKPKGDSEDQAQLTQPERNKTRFFSEVLNNWGFELSRLIVEDLELSPKTIKERERKQEAEINKDVATVNADIKAINVEAEAKARERLALADKEVLNKEGEGIAAQIKALIDAGVSAEEATQIVKDRFKWSEIGDKALIIDGGNGSVAADGAKLGAGMNMNNKTS